MGMIARFLAFIIAPIISAFITNSINKTRKKDLLEGEKLSFLVSVFIYIAITTACFIAIFFIIAETFIEIIR